MPSLAEAAHTLGYHERTLRGWIRKGELRANKEGRAWHVPATEIQRIQRMKSGYHVTRPGMVRVLPLETTLTPTWPAEPTATLATIDTLNEIVRLARQIERNLATIADESLATSEWMVETRVNVRSLIHDAERLCASPPTAIPGWYQAQ